MTTLRIALAQLNFLVGDIEGNADKIIQNALRAKEEFKADLIIFPELSLTGYPPEDLLFRPGLYQRTARAIRKLQQEIKEIDVIFGYPEQTEEGRYNAAGVLKKGEWATCYYKQCLPNYSVFDEMRYFKSGNSPCVIHFKGIPIGITICEDLWHSEPMAQTVAAGAKLVISINASPFDMNKPITRAGIMGHRAQEGHVPILYVNCVGSQDELIFDGGSMVVSATGDLLQRADFYKELLFIVDVQYNKGKVTIEKKPLPPLMSDEARVYNALVLGVRDYIEKNHFRGAVIGLSGGIDSALTLAIAVDAIGSDKVEGVFMPSRYSSEMSATDAEKQAKILNVPFSVIPIESPFKAFIKVLRSEFVGLPPDVTEENLQARCRGTILMAISNKKDFIVLATGNKSELSVGYATLYGDMVGGFCVLKDIFKTWVYRLAHYRNSLSPVIPQRIFDRPPSAELAFDQKDEDYLPPYPILDEILDRYIIKDESPQTIIDAGFDPNVVKRVIMMVDKSEYKRRQAAIGVKITERAFGRDRRYPITSGYTRYLKDE